MDTHWAIKVYMFVKFHLHVFEILRDTWKRHFN